MKIFYDMYYNHYLPLKQKPHPDPRIEQILITSRKNSKIRIAKLNKETNSTPISRFLESKRI